MGNRGRTVALVVAAGSGSRTGGRLPWRLALAFRGIENAAEHRIVRHLMAHQRAERREELGR